MVNITRKPKIGIVSYCNFVRTYANINHKYYAEKHGYNYIYDISPTRHDVFKNKIEKILDYLDLFDWVFWIDDDAFFTNFDIDLETFIKPNRRYDLIYCTSPVNDGKKTYLSSGNFFMKNTPRVKQFLNECLNGNLDEVKSRWNEEQFGIYTNGDQDIMVDLLFNDRRFNSSRFHVTLPFELFNTRPFHFTTNNTEHFLVHFTGNNKHDQALAFAERLNLAPPIIPKEEYEKYYGIYAITRPQDLPKTSLL